MSTHSDSEAPGETPGSGEDLSGSHDDLDLELAECLREPVERQAAALERACERHPEHAEALRRRFENLRALGLNQLCSEDSRGERGAGASNTWTDAPISDEPRRFGDYELGELIGIGGMGVVHRARQLSLDREVVLKLIRPEQLHFASSRERFRREAEAAARLRHPGIVPVHAVDEFEGVPFIVMESVEGRSLEAILDDLYERDPDSLIASDLAPCLTGDWIDACVEFARQVAEALTHAHGRGVLHRDVKPANVLVDSDGRARLVDFGLHRFMDEGEDQRVTRAGGTTGTLLYMAPEQLERGRYDERSEVYALGATLYELLTLRPPFHGEDRSATERAIRAGGAEPPGRRNPHVSRDLQAVVACALATEPARRYSTPREVADELGRVLAGEPVLARPEGTLDRAARFVRRQPALAATLALALVLAVGLPTSLYLQQRAHLREQERQNALLETALDEERLARAEGDDLSGLLLALFDTADPANGEPSPAMRSVLDDGTDRIERLLAEHPDRLALVRARLGRVHANFGATERGARLLEQALEHYEEEHDRMAADASVTDRQRREVLLRTIDVRSDLAALYERRGGAHELEALRLRERLADELERAWGPASAHTIVARANELRLRFTMPPGSIDDEARPAIDELIDALRGAVLAVEEAPDFPTLNRAMVHGWLGSTFNLLWYSLPEPRRGELTEEGVEAFERGREILEEGGFEGMSAYAEMGGMQALALKRLGRREEAAPLSAAALEDLTRRLNPGHPTRLKMLLNHSQLVFDLGRKEEALQLVLEAKRSLGPDADPDDPYSILVEGFRVLSLARLGRTEGLLEACDALLPRQLAVFGPVHDAVLTTYRVRADLLEKVERIDAARADLERALEILVALGRGASPDAIQIRRRLEEL